MNDKVLSHNIHTRKNIEENVTCTCQNMYNKKKHVIIIVIIVIIIIIIIIIIVSIIIETTAMHPY